MQEVMGMRFHCPHCLNPRVYPEPYRWYEWILALFWIRPFRCHRCGMRFLRSSATPSYLGTLLPR
jgi:hypothetical protein